MTGQLERPFLQPIKASKAKAHARWQSQFNSKRAAISALFMHRVSETLAAGHDVAKVMALVAAIREEEKAAMRAVKVEDRVARETDRLARRQFKRAARMITRRGTRRRPTRPVSKFALAGRRHSRS